MLGSRAIYHDGWKATTDHVGAQLTRRARARRRAATTSTSDHWALFDLDDDFAEAHDLAGEHPDALRALVELWWAEAGRNHVLPLEDAFIGRAGALEPSPWRSALAGGAAAGRRAGVGGRAAAAGAAASACRRTSRSAARGRGRHLRARRLEQRLGAATCSTAGPSSRSTCFGDVVPLRRRRSRSAPGRHALVVEYRLRRAAASTLRARASTARASRAGPLARDLPFRWQIGGAGLLVGRDRGFPGVRRLPAAGRRSAARSSAW